MNAGPAHSGKAPFARGTGVPPSRLRMTAFICNDCRSGPRTDQLDSFLRPFCRRRANTLRPSAVFIRFRNPVLRWRFFLDG